MFSLVAYSSDLVGHNEPPTHSRDDSECGNFRYVSLVSRTSSYDSNVFPPVVVNEMPAPHKQQHRKQLRRSTSDQALPESVSAESRVFKADDLDAKSRSKSGSKGSSSGSQEPCSSLELNVIKCKTNRDDEPGPCIVDNIDRNLVNLNGKNQLQSQNQLNGQHVPSGSINNSVLSTSFNALSNTSFGGGDDRRNRREINGQLILNNVNLSMDDERPAPDDDEISYSHIRYVNIFAILCCWCFPLTGIFTIVYSRLAKKYYEMRDKENAKKYLSKSEWLLMLTFFFGLTLIAVLLAFMDAYYFKEMTKGLHKTPLIAHILH